MRTPVLGESFKKVQLMRKQIRVTLMGTKTQTTVMVIKIIITYETAPKTTHEEDSLPRDINYEDEACLRKSSESAHQTR